MPDFPGISNAENCRDWEPGFPIDLERIRPKDEEYWEKYRGTPKAFVTLNAAQDMWANRFGDLTAFRVPTDETTVQEIEGRIARAIDPASIGLFFRPVRKQALAAAREGMDFGQLFLGFSSFLIIASLLLTALLFAFGVEQRAVEAGTLLAVGFSPGRVRRLFLGEGVVLAALGGILGTALGILYTRAVLRGLATVWSEAGGGARIAFHVEPRTLLIGLLASIAVSSLTIWLAVSKQAKSPIRVLLQSGSESGISILAPITARSRIALGIGLFAGISAVVLVLIALGKAGEKNVGLFFGAGSLLLISSLGFARFIVSRFSRSSGKDLPSLAALGVRNTERRSGRSLAIVGLLAVGSFLVVAVGANRHDPFEHSDERASGTGGFALYGETSIPVFRNLNTRVGLEAYGLTPSDVPGLRVVPLRLREGDDASCLNLNRAQVPRILGVRPESLGERQAFTFVKYSGSSSEDNPWLLLEQTVSGDAVPVIGDEPTLVWGLGKSVGDTIATTDGRGKTLNLRVVGIIASSILQGSLLMSDSSFVEWFPGESGYRVFLVDVAPDSVETVLGTLSRAFRDTGIDLVPAARRLAEFNSVENTYLAIFQALGGLGLILGSIGLGIVVLRNVLERRGELALLRAVGFDKSRIRWLILSEHWFLLAMGLLAGILSGILAVLPALSSPGADVPYASLALTLAVLLFSGLLWTWLAAAAALRGDLLPALRDE
jgi:ABC-type antimicrobial peptide transport system permease subunit